MADTFQNEVPRARINLKLSLHTGGAQKKVELPLKLLTIGDFSHGKENRPLSEREKINVNKNNFNSVLSEFSPEVNLGAEYAGRQWRRGERQTAFYRHQRF